VKGDQQVRKRLKSLFTPKHLLLFLFPEQPLNLIYPLFGVLMEHLISGAGGGGAVRGGGGGAGGGSGGVSAGRGDTGGVAGGRGAGEALPPPLSPTDDLGCRGARGTVGLEKKVLCI
jgi:hypothetical protein